MGRIKTSPIKRLTHQVMESYGDKLTTDFEQNKKLVEQVIDAPGKRTRNIIAGYVTRLKKTKEEY